MTINNNNKILTNQTTTPNKMKFGTVKCYNAKTGKGWISPADGSRDIPVNANAVDNARIGQLSPGQMLGFSVTSRDNSAVDLWATWSNR